ncbi:TonB-dependent receptor plug domain-containing protein [Flagellimonas nanhaiensis]|uniref:TonB-dependent receptor n=1 Tax=Flagellimonas nanhaiensis TaxID=2292706 RepID=A0A371JPX5_9FLAO|nr:TonB-dependent receptor [Allomuricauda nanhaiensis]RDY59568.1 TonB-dependent receptor [Allomuricauda nanhaiensis]
MRNTVLPFAFLLLVAFQLSAQQEQPIIKIDSLSEVVLIGNRIDLPFKENSRTINIVTAADIENSAAVNVADLLQQVVGVDIRRRGTGGSQADLYIRGGGFDQTLLLIDGIKMDDAQTGHHTMNAALPIEVIERIEIIKGPAARVFGQNAFAGAINIVTKKNLNNSASVNVETGSFGQLNGNVTAGIEKENSSHIVHVGRVTSEGYRNNSDYDNANYYLKSTFNKNAQPIEMIATFLERNFGAENFYTTNPTFHEYEETQNSLIAFSTTFRKSNLKIQPRIYWKRNQDMFLLRRDEPSFFRNFHISDKIGVETNASYSSKLGITGFGIDMSKIYLRSNNLGKRNRFMTNVFLEHRFSLLDNKLDITPGVALTYFSDFKFHAFPGLDIGYDITNSFKIYGNVGYTYRIPTYTDLYYSDPVTSGNEDLEPEEAFAQELGFKYTSPKINASIAVFNRDADNLIDYIRNDVSEDVFTATNITEVNTKGLEFDASYNFKFKDFTQTLSVGYAFLDDNILDQNEELSRYSLNTLKHQYTTRFSTQLFKNVRQNIIYKYAERTTGQTYNVWDASLAIKLGQADFTVTASNIFDAEYIESGFVPMPPSNVLFGLRYSFK